MRGQDERAARHPRRPVRPREDVIEALGPLEVDDEDERREDGEDHRDKRTREADERGSIAHQPEDRREEHRAGRDAFGEEIQHEIDAPSLLMRHVVVDARVAGAERIGIGRAERSQVHLPFAVHEGPRGDLRPDRRLIRTEVEHPWSRALLWLSDHEGFALDNPGNLARWIIQIAEDSALGRAHAHARRLQLVLHAIRAEVALLGRVGVRIDEKLIVRAGDHARATADARHSIQVDDAVAPAEKRRGWADLHARRVFALIAQHRKEQALRVWERALLNRLHPAAIHADGNVVLRLARDRTGVAADALRQVDREAVVRH